jgi:hypothetical protein
MTAFRASCKKVKAILMSLKRYNEKGVKLDCITHYGCSKGAYGERKEYRMDATSKSISELAWVFWKQGGQAKEEALSAEHLGQCKKVGDAIVRTNDGILKFEKHEEMIRGAVIYCAHSLLLPLVDRPTEFFRQIQEVWREEHQNGGKISAQALAYIHNEKIFDVFDLAVSASALEENPFGILHTLTEAFPFFIRINIPKVFELAERTYEKEKGDLAGGMMHNALSEWLVHYPCEARDIISQHIKEPKESSANLYRVAILAVGKADFCEGYLFATEGAASKELLVAGPAIDALGFFDYQLPLHKEEFERSYQTVGAVLADEDHKHFLAAAQTLTRLVDIDPTKYEALKQLGATGKFEALFALSNFLFFKQDKYGDQPWFSEIAFCCSAAQNEHHGIIRNLDMFLYGWIRRPQNQDQIVKWLETWIVAQDDATLRDVGVDGAFPSFMHEFANNRAFFQAVITRWLVHENLRFPRTAERIISYAQVHGIQSIDFDHGELDSMDAPTLLLLVRRMLGYVHRDATLLSLIWSLRNIPDAEKKVYQLMGSVLVTHLGYDFPKSTKEFISAEQSKLPKGAPLYQFCENILQNIAETFNALDALPRLKELEPAESRVRIVRALRHKNNQSLRKAAEKESVFLNIITKVPLKAGTGSFSLFQGGYTEINKLSSYSYAINIPRSEVIDQVGANHQRLLFRISKKGEP